jgi:hypothetical protein
MKLTTQAIRDQGFLTVECDVPEGVTLREWRARGAGSGAGDRRLTEAARPRPGRRGLLGRLR